MAAVVKADLATLTDTTPVKRKHTADEPVTNGVISPNGTQQSDILEVLRTHDTSPSFLEYEFKSTAEHTTKRAKLSHSATASIASKLSKGLYHTLEDLSKDAVVVSDAIVEQARDQQGDDGDRPSIDVLKRVQRTKMMRQTIEDLVRRELRHDSVAAVKQEEDTQVNGDVGVVLTLFGNAPGPKQLFSSFQNDAITSDGRAIKPALPIEELSLPNGLTTTKIKPISSLTAEKPTTFAEAFAPAASLPALSTPKSARRLSTRDSKVLWEFKDNTRGVKRGGYTTQTLATADWLSYGNTASSKEKQKQRTLSEGQDEDPAEQEEALFRQAYSSFAPAYDNSKSIVDVSLKNLVWWHKIGNKKYNARFSLDPALREYEQSTQTIKDDVIDDSGFAQAVEDYVDEEEPESTTDLTNVEEVLTKITTLLETLASMQVIRNAKAPVSNKTPMSPITSTPLQPDLPDKDEQHTYEQLQREIAYLVLQLPPYAVAKLDGNQLAELGVSKVITFESQAYRGQMEEDAAARLAKQTAAATAAGIASLARSTSNVNPQYGSRTPAVPQPTTTRYGLNAQYSSRSPASAPAPSRPLLGQQSYGTPTAAPRQYTPTTQYVRSGAPQPQLNGQYRGPTTQYYNNTFSQSQRPVQPAGQFQQRSHMAAANAVSYQTASPKPATPVNGIRPPPPLLARAASGTPQPNDVNGHA